MSESGRNYYKHLYLAQDKERIVELLLDTIEEKTQLINTQIDEKRLYILGSKENPATSLYEMEVISDYRKENEFLKKSVQLTTQDNHSLLNKIDAIRYFVNKNKDGKEEFNLYVDELEKILNGEY